MRDDFSRTTTLLITPWLDSTGTFARVRQDPRGRSAFILQVRWHRFFIIFNLPTITGNLYHRKPETSQILA